MTPLLQKRTISFVALIFWSQFSCYHLHIWYCKGEVFAKDTLPICDFSYVLMRLGYRGGGSFQSFSRSVIFPIFHTCKGTGHLLNIMFIFVRCRHSWNAVTCDKYECQLKYVNYTFAKSNFPVREKLINGYLVTSQPPHPWSDEWPCVVNFGAKVFGQLYLAMGIECFDIWNKI